MDSKPHTNEATHGQTDKMTGATIQCLNKLYGIHCQVIHVVTGSSDLTLALTAQIKSNTTIVCLECFNLRIEHVVVHQQAMHEHDGFCATTMFLVMQLNAVDRNGRQTTYLAVYLNF